MNTIERDIQPELLQMAREYPVITLVGPRQAGKTTLVKQVFADKPYVNMESPETQQLAMEDPQGLLERYPSGVIIDEVQRVPSLLIYKSQWMSDSKMGSIF